MVRLVFCLLIFLMITLGCSRTMEYTEIAKGALLVLNQANKTSVSVVEGSNTKSSPIGSWVQQIMFYNNNIYAIDSGSLEKPKKILYKINSSNMEIQNTLELSYKPHLFTISGKYIYITTTLDEPGKGFPLMIVDIEKFKEVNVIFTKGYVGNIKQVNNQVFASINSGGPKNYGQFSNILIIQDGGNTTSEFWTDSKEELPPGNFVVNQNKMIAVYSGFARGPKPNWVKNPNSYTNKVKFFDLKTKKITNEITLNYDFPQNIVLRDDGIAFINHYSDIDMSGNVITVLNTKTETIVGEIKGIPQPAAILLDGDTLYVANKTKGTITKIDSEDYRVLETIKVGEWPSQIIKIAAN